MDLFIYGNTDAFTNGASVVGWDSLTWIERYQDTGEFVVEGALSSGLREQLPLGSLIGHSETYELMFVENHEIKDDPDEDPIIVVSGRSFESYLEQRVVGQNQNWATAPVPYTEVVLAADVSWEQIATLVNNHIVLGLTINASDGLSYVATDTNVVGLTGTVQESRVIKRGYLYTRMHELLQIDNLGIKTIRSHTFDSAFVGPYTTMVVHNGVDLSKHVVFSVNSGDVDALNYLWSTKRMKNAALVSGRWVEVMIPGPSGYEKRVLYVDASDLDSQYETVPTSTTLADIKTKMQIRGRAALRAHNSVTLSRADIVENPTLHYRKDYNIGDIVGVDGNFGTTMPMRVVEYAEIIDQNGASGHPTLAVLDPPT